MCCKQKSIKYWWFSWSKIVNVTLKKKTLKFQNDKIKNKFVYVIECWFW